MEIKVKKGRAEKYPCELLLLFSFESPEALAGPIQNVDLKWNGFISTLMKQGDFKGELFECRLTYTQGALPAKRVVLTGLGKRGEFDLEKWRGAASKAGQLIRNSGIKKFAFPIEQFDGFSEAVSLARDLVNGPSNQVTPSVLAEKAQQIAKDHSMEIQVMEVSQAEAMGMGAFVAVAKGSQEPGKFIILEYNKDKGLDTIALVGKGITFDSGGISIKPSEGMERMKDDMSGAAAGLAILQEAPEL